MRRNFIFHYQLMFLFLFIVAPFSYGKVTTYLPLQKDTLLEQKVEQLFLLAQQPIVKRPIAINRIELALNKVCPSSSFKHCQEIRRHLEKSLQTSAVTYGAVTMQHSDRKIASLQNKRGFKYEDNYLVESQLVFNLNQYVSASVGAQLSNSEQQWEDTYISFGTDWAQIDLGYKPHWFSPFQHSAMLISSHAQTMATLSLSNSTPLTPLNISYELFVGEMSESNRIRYQGEYINGKPILTGFHLEFNPLPGFSLAVNRLLQSGGGDRQSNSFEDLLMAFLDPSGADNTSDELGFDEQFGNQNASITSRYTFAGDKPFSIYMEYAGEDTSRGSNWRLGNSALSAGLYLPFLTENLSVTYEWSDWQNGWFSHSVYRDGMSNKGNIIGLWAAEYRTQVQDFSANSVGGQHHFLQLNWTAQNGDAFDIKLASIKNESYGSINYQTSYKAVLGWQTQLANYPINTEFESGQDAFGDSYYRVSAKVGL